MISAVEQLAPPNCEQHPRAYLKLVELFPFCKLGNS